MTFEEISIGDNASLTKTITNEMIRAFADISDDHNPVHLDEAYAEKTVFKGRVAHGILVTGLISAVLGNKLPGEGAIYMSQAVQFLRPVRPGDEITATVEAISKDEKKKTVTFRTVCTNQIGKKVIDGEAVGLPPKA